MPCPECGRPLPEESVLAINPDAPGPLEILTGHGEPSQVGVFWVALVIVLASGFASGAL